MARRRKLLTKVWRTEDTVSYVPLGYRRDFFHGKIVHCAATNKTQCALDVLEDVQI